jgi:hemoglobin
VFDEEGNCYATTFKRLTEVFYEKVLRDEVLEPVFRHMPPGHSRHVAWFMTEVLKGPKHNENNGSIC